MKLFKGVPKQFFKTTSKTFQFNPNLTQIKIKILPPLLQIIKQPNLQFKTSDDCTKHGTYCNVVFLKIKIISMFKLDSKILITGFLSTSVHSWVAPLFYWIFPQRLNQWSLVGVIISEIQKIKCLVSSSTYNVFF